MSVADVIKIIAGVLVFLLSLLFCTHHEAPQRAVTATATDSTTHDAQLAEVGSTGTDLSIDDALTVSPAAVLALQSLLTLKNIEFVSGKAVFTRQGKSVADEVAGILSSATEVRFEVAGHTDSLGDATANKALSLARAEVVIAYLKQKGLATDRFSAKGYGSDRPVADNATRDGRQKNRRIEFVQAGG
jgi:outer membrane protein OmpA-like peptidoglycan-associated protein